MEKNWEKSEERPCPEFFPAINWNFQQNWFRQMQFWRFFRRWDFYHLSWKFFFKFDVFAKNQNARKMQAIIGRYIYKWNAVKSRVFLTSYQSHCKKCTQSHFEFHPDINHRSKTKSTAESSVISFKNNTPKH